MMNNNDWNLEDEEKDFADYCERCESGLRKSNVYERSDVEEHAAFESQNPFDTFLLLLCLQRRNKCEGELL